MAKLVFFFFLLSPSSSPVAEERIPLPRLTDTNFFSLIPLRHALNASLVFRFPLFPADGRLRPGFGVESVELS